MKKKSEEFCPSMLTRWMCGSDFNEIVDIDDSWSKEDLSRFHAKRRSVGIVLQTVADPSKIVGFMLYDLHADRVELIRFAIHPQHRRHGLGKLLMARLKKAISRHGRPRVACDVSELNVEAQLFLRAVGWRCVRVDQRNGLSGEDTYRFTYAAPVKSAISQEQE